MGTPPSPPGLGVLWGRGGTTADFGEQSAASFPSHRHLHKKGLAGSGADDLSA